MVTSNGDGHGFGSPEVAFEVLEHTNICVLSSGNLEVHCGTCRYCVSAQPAIRYLREQFALLKGDRPSNSAERALEGYDGPVDMRPLAEALETMQEQGMVDVRPFIEVLDIIQELVDKIRRELEP